MNKKTRYTLALIGGETAITTLALANIANAAGCSATDSVTSGADCAQGNQQPTDLATQIRTVTNVLLWIVGIAAVIMLIIGGFQYIFSSGDQQRVATAKNTILYAIIGIVVALLAYAVVTFVVGKFAS